MVAFILCFYAVFSFLLFLKHRDVEINPGPKENKQDLFLVCVGISFLSQCVICEVTLQRQKGYVIVIYRSPSQTAVKFDEFLSNPEKLLN